MNCVRREILPIIPPNNIRFPVIEFRYRLLLYGYNCCSPFSFRPVKLGLFLTCGSYFGEYTI